MQDDVDQSVCETINKFYDNQLDESEMTYQKDCVSNTILSIDLDQSVVKGLNDETRFNQEGY